jgi:hypothetical protein
MESAMKKSSSVTAGAVSIAAITLSLLAVSPATAVTLDLASAVLTGGATLSGNSIKFDANTAGETATFSFASVPGELLSINVTGQNNSSSFFNFLIDAGNGIFVSLASNINFGSGFNTITLPSFVDAGTIDRLQIVNGGTNSGGQISGAAVNVVPLPAAIMLFMSGLAGMFLVGRRKRKVTATA